MEKFKDAPGLEEISQLFPPSSSSAPVANTLMKLPAAAEVWFAQADAHFSIRSITVSKTKFYNVVASSGSGLSDSGSYPSSSCWRSLWSSQGKVDNFLLPEKLPAIWGSGLLPSYLASDELDISSPPGWLQAWLHPPGTVPASSSDQRLIFSRSCSSFLQCLLSLRPSVHSEAPSWLHRPPFLRWIYSLGAPTGCLSSPPYQPCPMVYAKPWRLDPEKTICG